jgi:long-chain acyl-CoA synthetase
MLSRTFRDHPEETGYRVIHDSQGTLENVQWNDFYRKALQVSRALVKSGVEKGDTVAILGFTSLEWVLADLGTVFIGGCSVGIYHSLLAADCEYIIRHSRAKIVFVEDHDQLEKVLSVRKKIPEVEKVILFKGEPPRGEKRFVLSLEDFLSLGEKVKEKKLEERIDSIKPGDLATIVYTSGTTGVPRGVMLTHDNIIFTCQMLRDYMPIEESDETILFLPLAHIFARVDLYTTILANITLGFCRSLDTVVEDIQVIRPHWFPSVPRVFEKIYLRIKGGVEEKGGAVELLFNWAMKNGYRVSDRLLQNRPIPPFLKLKYALASKLVFKKIHNALGGRVRFCVSGAAPLNSTVARFFHAAGIPILEGYGMTENTSFTNATRLDALKFGSVGFHPSVIEQKIADTGEILYRGRNIMKGYYRTPSKTKEVIDKDGWLHTGDVGFVDDDGFLTITGRLKDIIITSGGKNIPPLRIESIMLTSKYIGQICVVGDGKKYLTALISLDPDNTAHYARENGIPFTRTEDLNDRQEIIELIQREIDRLNEKLASYETLKDFLLVPEFTIESGLLTPTMKIKRNEVLAQYEKEIDKLYETSR